MKTNTRWIPYFVFLCFFSLTILFPEIVYADSPISAAGTKDVDKVTKVLASCVEAAGDLSMLFGVVKYGIGMSSDQPKELTTGITSLVTGVILANITTVLGI